MDHVGEGPVGPCERGTMSEDNHVTKETMTEEDRIRTDVPEEAYVRGGP